MTDYVPHTDKDREKMLQAINVSSMASLFDDVPPALRFPELKLPKRCSESELSKTVQSLAESNRLSARGKCFLGAGSYQHSIPAIVDDVLRRSEFYTSYTPYQPELSQGMLQATFEYQTMICRLTGMEISNASHYDGATALAEAILMALRKSKLAKSEVLMAAQVNPRMRDVSETYLQGTDTVVVKPERPKGPDALIERINDNTAAVVVQQPDYFGMMHDIRQLSDATHQHNAVLIVVVDPLSLAIFNPPSEYGADIVVAEGQCFGLPLNFGGPGLGIMAARKEFARQMPGRLVGETLDSRGEPCYVLTLATREQHIRRERATSNICTNAALSALASAVYLSVMGKAGLKQLAELCFHRAHYAANRLDSLPGITVNPWNADAPFFREFVVELPDSAIDISRRLYKVHGITAGYVLGKDFPALSNHLLIAVTDVNSRNDIDDLVGALESLLCE